jgi:hypothetical protein
VIFKLLLKVKLIQVRVKYPSAFNKISSLFDYKDKLKNGPEVLTGFTGYSREIKISRDLTMKSFMTTLSMFILMLNNNFVRAETSVLFIGNSFTYGYGSAAK